MRTMYDSTDPTAIPANAQMVAGYIDGQSFRWPESAWDRFTGVKVRIARRTYTDDGHVLDVEEGIPTVWPINGTIVDWVLMRRASGVEPTIYCNQLNDWDPIRGLFRNAGVSEPSYWVARYDNRATLPRGAVAKQYANPAVHGAGHYDLSSVADHWPGVDKESTMAFDELDKERIRQIHSSLGSVFTYTNGTPIDFVFNRLYDFVRDGGNLAQLTETLARTENKIDALTALVESLADFGTFTPEGTIRFVRDV